MKLKIREKTKAFGAPFRKLFRNTISIKIPPTFTGGRNDTDSFTYTNNLLITTNQNCSTLGGF